MLYNEEYTILKLIYYLNNCQVYILKRNNIQVSNNHRHFFKSEEVSKIKNRIPTGRSLLISPLAAPIGWGSLSVIDEGRTIGNSRQWNRIFSAN